MAYAGYLVKVGTYKIPLKYIKFDSYSVTMNSQDLDSYRDANGLLHRNALKYVVPKVEFETVPMLTQSDVNSLMGNMRNNMNNQIEKSANVEFYIPELDKYVTQNAYLVDIEFSPYLATAHSINYKPFRIAFVGYGGEA